MAISVRSSRLWRRALPRRAQAGATNNVEDTPSTVVTGLRAPRWPHRTAPARTARRPPWSDPSPIQGAVHLMQVRLVSGQHGRPALQVVRDKVQQWRNRERVIVQLTNGLWIKIKSHWWRQNQWSNHKQAAAKEQEAKEQSRLQVLRSRSKLLEQRLAAVA